MHYKLKLKNIKNDLHNLKNDILHPGYKLPERDFGYPSNKNGKTSVNYSYMYIGETSKLLMTQ